MVRSEIGGQEGKLQWSAAGREEERRAIIMLDERVHTVLSSCSQAMVMIAGLLSTVKRFPSRERMSRHQKEKKTRT